MNIKTLSLPLLNWVSNFPNGELPLSEPKIPILLIAIDTEYQSNYTYKSNLCLSYQSSIYDMYSGKYKQGIFYMNVNEQERLSISELLKNILKKIDIPISSLEGYRIIFIAHFFTAEWSMLKDRMMLHEKFEYIRKTLITTTPLNTTIEDENGNTVNLYIDFKDTMLLLPDGYKSLEKASTFINGFEKIDLSTEIKSNMYQFLQDQPELFEKYAIRDAEVTLKLFIKLQYLLNTINSTEDIIYPTLANATVTNFKLFSQNKFNTLTKKQKIKQRRHIHSMQFDRLHSEYIKSESLANRAYMGGLNSSYHIGYSNGYTFLDIDFKNAYPTAMNLLKIGDFGTKIKKERKKKVIWTGLKNDNGI